MFVILLGQWASGKQPKWQQKWLRVYICIIKFQFIIFGTMILILGLVLWCHSYSHWIWIGFDLKIAAWGYMLHIRTVPTLHGNVGAARLLHPSRVHGVRGLVGGYVSYYVLYSAHGNQKSRLGPRISLVDFGFWVKIVPNCSISSQVVKKTWIVMHVTGFRSRSRHVVHLDVGMFDFWPARCMKKRLICHERPLHRRLKYEVRSLLLLTKGISRSSISVAKPNAHDVSHSHISQKSTSFFTYFMSLSEKYIPKALLPESEDWISLHFSSIPVAEV